MSKLTKTIAVKLTERQDKKLLKIAERDGNESKAAVVRKLINKAK